MATVNVQVNGRSYSVSCDDGEENHLHELAAYLNRKVVELASGVGQVGESRLLLLAGLLIADELSDTLNKVHELETELAEVKSRRTTVVEQAHSVQGQIAHVLEAAARRIEDIAGRLGPA